MKSRLLVAAVGVPLLLVILLVCPKIITVLMISLLSSIGAREMLYTTGIVRQTRMMLYSMGMAFLMPLWSYIGCPILPGAVAVTVFGLLLLVFSL